MIYDLADELAQDMLCSIVDVNSKVLFASKSHLNLLGYRPNELLSLNLSTFVHPEDLSLVQSKFSILYSQRKSVDMTFRFKHQNGQWVTLFGNVQPYMKDGTIIYYLFTCKTKANIMQLSS